MPIRDMDSFAFSQKPGIKVTANRGASGIDGLLASALGFAQGLQTSTTLLLGDLSLFHDLNSLALLAKSPIPLVIVLINNKGGGIFHFLAISKHQDIFEPYFTTPHDLNFSVLAQAFGIPSQRIEHLESFQSAYQEALQSGRSVLLEVQTNREHNRAFHHKLNQIIQQTQLPELEDWNSEGSASNRTQGEDRPCHPPFESY